ncbi:ABC transporter permease [Nonomuraea sp. CA-141351]|uniref:ABC transporter permease n=1 Tax=Nonomuraea sp. CA-141351 TaxID=3239996 RepID=UPI003D8C8F71
MTFLALEIRRTLRAPAFLIVTLGMPVALLLIEGSLYGSTGSTYLMSGMAAYGALMAAISTGARVATERTAGWQRQLRLTPLSPPTYLAAKAVVSMMVALPPIVAVALAGAVVQGVRLPVGGWLQAVAGVWLATLPFAVLGLLIGQVATGQNVQAYSMGSMLTLSLAGGLWIPVTQFPGWLADLARVLPSYWLAAVGHGGELGTAVLVLGGYTVALAAAVMARYRRGGDR